MSVCRLCEPNKVREWAKTPCGSESCLARLNNAVDDILRKIECNARPRKDWGVWGPVAASLEDGETAVVDCREDVSALRLACGRLGFRVSATQDKHSKQAKFVCKRAVSDEA